MDLIRQRACPNPGCKDAGKLGAGNIIKHGSFVTQAGPRQRCCCKSCGRTFSANTSTAYAELRCTRDAFDQVVRMRVEGNSISSIARITGRARSSISRWLERAAGWADRFNDEHLRGFETKELQADELCTFVLNKNHTRWLFTAVEVTSRLWPTSVLGRRSYRNTELLFNEVVHRGEIVDSVLVTTDGFDYYERVVRRILGHACVYGQVIKTRRNNRVIRVQRKLRIGTKSHLVEALLESEDSEKLNTSYVERLNLTIRQSLAYLARRTPAHARCDRRLDEDLALVQCHYNFLRPHLALKFGTLCKTPAMQAVLFDRRLSWRDIFEWTSTSGLDAVILPFPLRPRVERSVVTEAQLAA